MNFTYSTDDEYRQVLRDIMYMIPAGKVRNITDVEEVSVENMDEITKDETNFDVNAISTFLDDIYAKTKDNEKFEKMYIAAASCMLSDDPTIGLAVLFSYDYLQYFYPCLLHYLKTGLFNETYNFLMRKFR